MLLTGDPALREIFEAALEKFRVGEQKHGPFDPATDPRDLLVEAEREILDAINYLAMHLLKLRTIGQGRCCGGSCKRSETGEGETIGSGEIARPGASSCAGPDNGGSGG